jgi:hypothetical protein
MKHDDNKAKDAKSMKQWETTVLHINQGIGWSRKITMWNWKPMKPLHPFLEDTRKILKIEDSHKFFFF